MSNDEGERLARVETKLDTLTELIQSYFSLNTETDKRLRRVELENVALRTAHEEANKSHNRMMAYITIGLSALGVFLKWGVK